MRTTFSSSLQSFMISSEQNTDIEEQAITHVADFVAVRVNKIFINYQLRVTKWTQSRDQ